MPPESWSTMPNSVTSRFWNLPMSIAGTVVSLRTWVKLIHCLSRAMFLWDSKLPCNCSSPSYMVLFELSKPKSSLPCAMSSR